jgi:hypothetical protein
VFADGLEIEAIPVEIVQADTALLATVACDGGMPQGTGTYSEGSLDLVFSDPDGDIILHGGGDAGGLSGSYADPEGSGTWTLTPSAPLDCEHACDPTFPLRFVTTDFVDLDLVAEISRFRSAAGHDYSDRCEDCLSMKHYYAPFPAYRDNGRIEIRSPVSGTIVSVAAESHGASPEGINKQIRVRSSEHPEYTFILFHVDLASLAVAPGGVVAAGDLLGHAHMYYPDLLEYAHDFDIAVRLDTAYGPRFVSWFDVMDDALFASYQARGVTDRSVLVISADERDADPLSCEGETFTTAGVLAPWVALSVVWSVYTIPDPVNFITTMDPYTVESVYAEGPDPAYGDAIAEDDGLRTPGTETYILAKAMCPPGTWTLRWVGRAGVGSNQQIFVAVADGSYGSGAPWPTHDLRDVPIDSDLEDATPGLVPDAQGHIFVLVNCTSGTQHTNLLRLERE